MKRWYICQRGVCLAEESQEITTRVDVLDTWNSSRALGDGFILQWLYDPKKD